MSAIEHGNWTLYDKPRVTPLGPIAKGDKAEMERRSKLPPNIVDKEVPGNIAYAKREDGTDWYDFLETNPFAATSMIVLLSNDGIVLDAAQDATRLFPAGTKVVEVTDWQGEKPEGLVNKRCIVKTQKFEELPMDQRPIVNVGMLREMIASLVKRVEKLEKK